MEVLRPVCGSAWEIRSSERSQIEIYVVRLLKWVVMNFPGDYCRRLQRRPRRHCIVFTRRIVDWPRAGFELVMSSDRRLNGLTWRLQQEEYIN